MDCILNSRVLASKIAAQEASRAFMPESEDRE